MLLSTHCPQSSLEDEGSHADYAARNVITEQ